MAAPEGYSALAKIGFVDRGTYAAATTYNRCDVVYYGGSTYVALKDNLKGVTPANGANWKYMARGFAAEVLAAITAVDASGVIGTPGASVSGQALIDGIADKVMTKLILRSKIVNNLLATDTTTVLSGPMGKQLDEKIDSVISDITIKSVGNAISAPGWTVTASNLVMNGIGLVYGTITHNTDNAPVWGELVGTFPNFSARYNIPVLLFVTSGTVYVTANISQVGELKLYGPDFEKLNIKGKVYHFNAIYYAGN